MGKARRIRFLGEAEGHAAAVARLEVAGDAVLDRRGRNRAVIMKCPDGCGDVLTVNLDPRAGKAWRLDQRAGALSLYPSVWRHEGCKSHFILWRDWLLWSDSYDEYRWQDESLTAETARILTNRFEHYADLAERLGVVPWEALWACQDLVRQGKAECKDRSNFRAIAGGSRGKPGKGILA